MALLGFNSIFTVAYPTIVLEAIFKKSQREANAGFMFRH